MFNKKIDDLNKRFAEIQAQQKTFLRKQHINQINVGLVERIKTVEELVEEQLEVSEETGQMTNAGFLGRLKTIEKQQKEARGERQALFTSLK